MNCYGPTGPCELELFHGGDHKRPTSDSIRKSDTALWRSLNGMCPFCGGSLDDDFRCAVDCQGDRQ